VYTEQLSSTDEICQIEEEYKQGEKAEIEKRITSKGYSTTAKHKISKGMNICIVLRNIKIKIRHAYIEK
jgi:hypothetical protein